MNQYLLSVLLGIIEGLTEFLPISSTAHLRIAQEFLKVNLESEYWKMYSVVIQLGAILSVVVYFRGRIVKFVRTFPRGEMGDRTIWNHPLTLTLAAFVLTAGPALLLSKKIGKNLENLHIMAWALVGGGVVMWLVDAIYRHPRIERVEQMSLWQAAWIGIAQIVSAILPGTSRSMVTIAAGQVGKMSRPAALEFSFFLSIPTMFAACGYSLWKIVKNRAAVLADPAAPADPWIVLAIGFVVSFVVAWAVVAWFMHWVRRRGFAPFAVYRIVFGIALLAWLARH